MKDSAAYRYAMALSEIEGANLKNIEDSLQLVVGLFGDNPQLKSFYESPKVPSAQKKEAVKKAFDKSVDKHVSTLLQMLIDKRRTALLYNISESFTEIVDKSFNRVRPIIAISRDFSDADQTEVIKKVEDLIKNHGDQFGISDGKSADFISKILVDESLIGGVTLRIGDYQWDSSVKKYLREWKSRVHKARIDQDSAKSLSE